MDVTFFSAQARRIEQTELEASFSALDRAISKPDKEGNFGSSNMEASSLSLRHMTEDYLKFSSFTAKDLEGLAQIANQSPPKTSRKKSNSSDQSEAEEELKKALGDRQLAGYVFFLSVMEEEKKKARQGRGFLLEDQFSELLEAANEIMKGLQDEFASIFAAALSSPLGSGPIEQPQDASAATVNGSELTFFQATYRRMTSTSVSATMQDERGNIIQIDASLETEVSVSVSAGSIRQGAQTGQADPLVLDINGDGNFSLTNPEQGVNFDITGDGVSEQTAFVTGGDYFLALDRNSNGQIDSGKELFGDQHGAANGFLELAKFDDNLDGFIDTKDSIYEHLLAVTSENGVLLPTKLLNLGVESISLLNENTDMSLGNGNSLSQLGSYQTTAGSTLRAGDVMLKYLVPVHER